MGRHAAPVERARLMRKLGDLITANVPAISETETHDTGQVIGQTRKQLVPRAADNFHYFAEMCVRVDGHTYPTPTHLNYTLFHPVGVCALISPWNVPFMTATWKVAPCLAFGNTAVLKMSELSPLTAARLGELALEAGIPAGVLNVVHGYGGEAGEALVLACRRARDLLHRLDRHRQPHRPERGPEEVLDGARRQEPVRDLRRRRPRARARRRGVHDLLATTASAARPARASWCRRRSTPEFVEALRRARRKRIAVGDPLDEKTIVGPMISKGHLEKVRSYIELGSEEGATLLCGGLDAPALPAGAATGQLRRSRRSSPTSTTACASPRRRSSARSPA